MTRRVLPPDPDVLRSLYCDQGMTGAHPDYDERWRP